jgi:hypothetical protein
MKKEKMSLERMKSVLSNVLSRDEMKQVLAGSGPLNCVHPWICPTGARFNNYKCGYYPPLNGCRCEADHSQLCA